MARRARIAVLIKGLGIGGAETLIAEAVSFWDRERYDYRVAYLLPWKDQLVPPIVASGVAVAQLGNGRMGMTTFRAVRSYLDDLQPDIVHAHLPSTGILARMTAHTPVVYTEHNVVTSYRFPTRLINRLTYSRNSVTIAVSGAVAESLTGYPGPEPMVIPNGVSVSVDETRRDLARDELGIGEETILFVHVGNIRPHKGHQNLIEAVDRLNDRIDGFMVVSVGGEKHEGDLDRITTEAERRGLAARIRFLGRREDAVELIAAADIVVNPSDHEGLPLAVLEAMSLGKPVVATDVGGVSAAIADGVTGLLVPPGDPAALADAMSRLAADPMLRRRLGEKARVEAGSRYGLERMVRAVEEVYEGILGS